MEGASEKAEGNLACYVTPHTYPLTDVEVFKLRQRWLSGSLERRIEGGKKTTVIKSDIIVMKLLVKKLKVKPFSSQLYAVFIMLFLHPSDEKNRKN